MRRLNRMCGPSVVVRDAAWAESQDFSARFIRQVAALPIRHLERAGAERVSGARRRGMSIQPLSLPALRLACDPLIGEHDFSSFCRRPRSVRRAGRALDDPNVMLPLVEVPTDYGAGLLRFEIRANAFCHQMVRSIVGTMVDAGAVGCTAGDIRGILLAKDRQAAGQVAPPQVCACGRWVLSELNASTGTMLQHWSLTPATPAGRADVVTTNPDHLHAGRAAG